MHVEVFIPNLFWPQANANDEAYAGLDFPALVTLLARSEVASDCPRSLEACLRTRFGLGEHGDLPLAALALVASGIETGSHYWLCADPVHLRVGRDRLVLADASMFNIRQEEANALVATLNAHFGADGLQFFAPKPDEWFVRAAPAPSFDSTPLAQVRAGTIDQHLPTGADARRWIGIQNEAQMLLHEHAINLEREARGEVVINSVWFSGGGVLPQVDAAPASSVLADLAWVRGLARLVRAKCAALPDSLANAPLLAAEDNHKTMIVVDALRAATAYGDIAGWRETMSRLEADYFVPLMAALRAREITRLSFIVPDDHGTQTFSLAPSALWRFWRGRRPLGAYAAVSG
jgi:hypothetical protein